MSAFGAKRPQIHVPSAPPANDWKHLWRCVDATTGNAPDTGSAGGADLTLSGGYNLNAVEGIEVTEIDFFSQTLVSNLSIDLSNVAVPHTLFMVGRLTASAGNRRFIASNENRPIEANISSDGLNASFLRTCGGAQAHSGPHGATQPFEYAWVLTRDGLGIQRGYMLVGGVVAFTTPTDSEEYATHCTSGGGTTLILGNRVTGARAPRGFFRWAGMLAEFSTEQEIVDIVNAGRPPAP